MDNSETINIKISFRRANKGAFFKNGEDNDLGKDGFLAGNCDVRDNQFDLRSLSMRQHDGNGTLVEATDDHNRSLVAVLQTTDSGYGNGDMNAGM